MAWIAARMDNCREVFPTMGAGGFPPDCRRGPLDVLEVSADAGKGLGLIPNLSASRWFRDERYRVVWRRVHPHALVEDLFY